MTDLAVRQTEVVDVVDVLDILADEAASLEDWIAAYAVGQQFRLRIDRGLKSRRDDIIVGLERQGLKEFGPLSVKATAIDVRWPANDEGNWGDSSVQEAMEQYAKVAPEYFRHVPDHWEIDSAALGAGVAEGDPVAQQLHRECKEKGWRTEVGRRLSLAVREARRSSP